MRKNSMLLCGVLAAAALALPAPAARAHWGVRIGIGFPIFVGPPCWYHPCYPVVVQPAPVVVQPVPVYQPVYPAPVPVPAPAAAVPTVPAAPVVARSVSPEEPHDLQTCLQRLQQPDERERIEAIGHLGRLRSPSAIGPLAGALNNDRSPAVRDAAAKALGLIGSPDALAALQRAAQADEDRDVRRDASYAADVIRASLPRR